MNRQAPSYCEVVGGSTGQPGKAGGLALSTNSVGEPDNSDAWLVSGSRGEGEIEIPKADNLPPCTLCECGEPATERYNGYDCCLDCQRHWEYEDWIENDPDAAYWAWVDRKVHEMLEKESSDV